MDFLSSVRYMDLIEHQNLLLLGGFLVAALFTATAIQAVRQWYRLRHIPGPLLAGFTRLWLIGKMGGGNVHSELGEVSRKYGPLARIGPDELLTSDPALLRRILGVRTRYQRSEWYDAMRFDPNKASVLTMRDDEQHGILRAKMSFGYSGKDVEEFERKVDRNVMALVKLIEEKYLSTDSETKPFDFGHKANYFTLDTISDVAYSEPFGCMATDSDVFQYIKAVDENLPVMVLVATIPSLTWIMKSRVVKKFLPSDKDQLGFGRVLGNCKKMAAKRYGPDRAVRRDMLGSFVRNGLTQSEAESETLTQILAGSETTATAIRATVLYIITNPRVYRKLQAQIENATVSSPITDAEARTLPYMQAVIKEGLRMLPPVSALMSKLVPPEGDTWNGMYMPGGTKIAFSAIGTMRNKAVWGDDANIFKPERWLQGSLEKIREQEAALELVFGYGRWQCLGKNLAHMELNKVFFELFRHFDLALADPIKPWTSKSAGVIICHKYWLVATRRET